MLAEAVRQGLLTANPCDKVRRLKNDRKKITILTDEEVKKLFPKNYKTVWGDKVIAYAACRLASLTGMRIGEILGLRGEYVSDKSIYICGQYGDEGYLPYTKNKENRNIPLIPEIIALLRGLGNGDGFVFSMNGGAVPVTQAYIRKAFHNAMKKIGISEAEIKRRALTIHGWRHFLNTELLKQGLTIPQVQGVTGHKSVGMTERYNPLGARQIADVMKAQAAIAGTQEPEKEKPPKETGKAESNTKGLKIVKMTARKSA
jgi:integrase